MTADDPSARRGQGNRGRNVDQPLGSRYVLHQTLGRGAMGQVFAGTVRESGDRVAIKVLKPELVSDPEAVARFMQERQILTSIRNPNVVRVVDLVAEGETLAIVMELIEGQDLRRHLREQGTLPPAEAIRLLIQLLYGLSAVHGAGVVHRDVKPENLLLDTSAGRPLLKLTDFGVARLSYGASLTKLSSLIGTPEYMAPELAESASASYAADLRILRSDPVVEWQVQIPAATSVTIGYRATVPADGASHARLTRWAQDFDTLQAQLPTPKISSPAAHPSQSAIPTVSSPATVPTITAPSAPSAPATSQHPEPAASMAAGAQAYASGSLGTSSSAVTASVYFGQLNSVISALSGQVSFNTSSSLLASNPDLCASTVVFSGVSSPTGAVYAEGLGSGWTAAESPPSQDTQNGMLHQQLIVPPAGIPAGASWQGSAKLVAGSLAAQSGSFGLHLESQNGAAQTWLANGQTVTCNS